MAEFDIYKDIAERTDGDIYIGVVGPVRTGKSTFIKRFMDLLVLPNIENEHIKERATDELPQSAAGRLVMTTEPKFVPNQAVQININDNTKFNVRMIDCVGYLVPGAEGYMEDGASRMINTPWSDKPLPFAEAAEMGTRKVINEHSTIGIVVTTDGSITDIPRENYVEAEKRVINELKTINKPFIVILNSSKPYSNETESLRGRLEEEYGVPVMTENCANFKVDDINAIMEKVLFEFPIKELRFDFPKWTDTLGNSHWLKQEIIAVMKEIMVGLTKLCEIKAALEPLMSKDFIRKAYIDTIKPGEGMARIEVSPDEGLFYRVLSETIDMPVENDYQLISTIKQLSGIKREYDKIEYALSDLKRKGYGVVSPVFEEIKLDPPEIFKQGSRYGIKLKARGETIHMIKADIETEVSPIVGSEEQSRDFIDSILKEYESNPEKIWELNIFGRTLSGLVNDGMRNKIYQMPEDAQLKLQETLQKIVNEGSGGLICILL
ncbi:MAG: stage IV sporulation protein A [Lachnospiraceae bacterium]|nr:stage IV sporulation protein A [Lachnospiraceae bacterium]